MRGFILAISTSLIMALATSALAEHPMTPTTHPYVGLWVTDDDQIRHELLPNGRYVEARGRREGAYRGRYEVKGTHIDYWDDTGFTADGEFVNADTLHHGGMVLRRRGRAAPAAATR
jgi:hypothetical protein